MNACIALLLVRENLRVTVHVLLTEETLVFRWLHGCLPPANLA